MEDNNLKKVIMDSINNDCVPNLQTRIVTKYQQSKKQKKHSKLFLLISSPLLVAASVAMAIVIPTFAKQTVEPQKSAAQLLAEDKEEISFNLDGAIAALSIIDEKNYLSPNMRHLSSLIDFEEMFDLTEDVETMFDIVNPYMPTVVTLLNGESAISEEILTSDNANYQFMMGDLYFNILNETEFTYDIEGILMSTNVSVSGGRFFVTNEDEQLSVFLLNFQYSETSYLSFSHVFYEHEKEFADSFHNEYRKFRATDYYEYALYENDKVTSFVSLNRFIRDDKIFVYMNQNVPHEDNYVNVELRFENDNENNAIYGEFDLIDDHRQNSHLKDRDPIKHSDRDDKHGHKGHRLSKSEDVDKTPAEPEPEPEHQFSFGGRIKGDFYYYEDETSYNYEYLLKRGGFISEYFGHRHDNPHEDLPELEEKERTLYQILK